MNASDSDMDLSPWGGNDLDDHFMLTARDRL